MSTQHPSRRNLDNTLFLDFDEILALFPVLIKFSDEKNSNLLRDGYAVDGFTKTGLKLSNVFGIYLFEDRKSGKPDECINFITSYWMSQ